MLKNGQKRCPRCGEWKPAEGNFYSVAAKRGDGLSGYCIACTKAKAKEWFRTHRERHRANQRAFWHRSERRREQRRQRGRRVWTSLSPEQRAEQLDRLHTWHKEHPERRKAWTRNWRKSNRDRIAIAQRKYHQKPEWKEINRLRNQVKNAFYRSGAKLGRADWQAVLTAFDHRCAYCQRHLRLLIEHLTPLSRWPRGTRHRGNWLGNIAPACGTCNGRKWTKTLDEYAAICGCDAEEIRGIAEAVAVA